MTHSPMGTLSSRNAVLQDLCLCVLLVQAQASMLLSSRPHVLPDLLLENVESCGCLYTEAKALANHQGQRQGLWELQRLSLLCPQSGLVSASSGASGLSCNLSYLCPHDLFYFNNPSDKRILSLRH